MKKILLLVCVLTTSAIFAQDCTIPATLPYFEDFSNGAPACWEYENTDGTNPVWTYNDSVDITGDGTNDPVVLMIPPNVSTEEKNDWAFTRKIQMDAGTEYSIEVAYNAFNLGNVTASENFELVITDAPSSTASYNEIIGTYTDFIQQGTFPGQNDGNDIKTQAYTASETFTPTTSGEYYVAIHALGSNGTDGGGFFLFSASVEETPVDCTIAVTVPYSEDFSNGTPVCWEYENTDGTNPVWTYNDSVDITGDGTNDPVLLMIPPNVSTEEKNDWAFTRKIQMDAGTEYSIEVAYNAFNLGNVTASENFELVITDAPSSTASYNEIIGTYTDFIQQGTFPGQNDGNDIKTQAYTASETFTPTTSGGYYVAIHALGSNGTDGGGFFLFNLSVEESIVPPCSVAATVPYYEDFSNGDPECWLKEDTDNTLPVWMYNTGTDIDGDGIGDPIYQIIAPGTQDPLKNDWAFSQKVHMEAGTTYYVSSHYNVVDLGSSTSFEDFEMWVTDAQSSNASFKELLNTYQGITQQGQFPGQSNGNDLEAMAYLAEEGFTPTTTGDYYVGIHATGSTAIGGAFLLFDVGVNTEPTAQDCTEAAVTPYYEDFSNGSPACWEYEDADNQNPVWAYNNTTDISGDGTNDPILIMAPANVSTTQKDDYAFSKKIQLIAGVEYIIEVAYNSLNLGNAVASENFDLIITDEPNATATQTVLGSYNDILQQGDFPGNNDGNDLESQAYTASEVFTPTTSGEYYVGVHALGTTGTDAGGLLLFDLGVSVNTVPSGGELIIIPTTGYVTSVNYNGTAAAGYNTEHFIWNGNGNFEVIGGVPPGNGIGGQTGISDDGNTVSAGYLNTVSGLVEMSTYEISTQTWTSLGGIGGDDGVEASSTYAISGDATTVVGLGYTEAGGPGGAHAVAWTEATGVVDLGSTVPQAFSRANATNVDGTVIAGWQDTATGFRQGAVWINGVQHLIDFPNGDKAGEAQTVSNDGVWVGGIGNFANNHQAWRWNEDTEIESLGPSPIQGYRGATTGLSEDGSIAVGYYKPGSLPAIFGVGFIWTEATGVVELNEYAATLGIDTQGVTLALPLDISADGTAIVGSGLDSNNNRVGFLLRLEPTILGVDEPTIEDTFSYYPNPVNDVLHFSGTTPLKSITIYTVTGQIVAQKAITSTKGELNISELANGIYIARIEGYESSKTVKIIKK